MATSGPVNGTLIRLFKDVSGTLRPVANILSHDFSVEKTLIDVTSQSSGAADEFITGRYRWSGSGTGIYEEDTSVGTTEMSFQDIITDLMAGTAWTVAISTNVTGDNKISGTAYLSNVTINVTDNARAEFSCDFTGSGTLSQAAIV